MAYISNPFAIDVAARQQHIDAASHVHYLLKELGKISFVERVLNRLMTRTSNWTIGQQRHYAGLSQHDRFIEKLSAVTHRRVFPVPVSPDHGGERTAAFGHHQVRGHRSAFQTVISYVVDISKRAMLHTNLFDIERRMTIVIKVAEEFGILG